MACRLPLLPGVQGCVEEWQQFDNDGDYDGDYDCGNPGRNRIRNRSRSPSAVDPVPLGERHQAGFEEFGAGSLFYLWFPGSV